MKESLDNYKIFNEDFKVKHLHCKMQIADCSCVLGLHRHKTLFMEQTRLFCGVKTIKTKTIDLET